MPAIYHNMGLGTKVDLWSNLMSDFIFSSVKFSFVRSHTFYFQGTELYVGPDPYQKGSITGN